LVALLYALLSNGIIDLHSLPLPGPIANLVSGSGDNEGEAGVDAVPTPGGSRTATRMATPASTSFKGGDAIRVRRGAEFRGGPDFKQDAFCKLTDETSGTVIDQEPGRSADASGRQHTIYPVSVRDASCDGGNKFAEMKGWVSDEFLRR
jgi:hypothetical protein